jgi:hypothetical protein
MNSIMHDKCKIVLAFLLCTASLMTARPVLAEPVNASKFYKQAGLEKYGLDKNVFEMAVKGYNTIPHNNRQYLTIVDFTQPSIEKRFYMINMTSKKMELNTWASHGKNSGPSIPNSFSNVPNSKQSSLGFYRTGEPYYGRNGYSMRLDGLEAGYNSNARLRAVVVHGADYVSAAFAKSQGRMGRSWGCPAVPMPQTRMVINKMKGGSILFHYSTVGNYPSKSRLVSRSEQPSLLAMYRRLNSVTQAFPLWR